MDLLVFGIILVLSVAFSPNGLVMLMKSLGLRAPAKAKEA